MLLVLAKCSLLFQVCLLRQLVHGWAAAALLFVVSHDHDTIVECGCSNKSSQIVIPKLLWQALLRLTLSADSDIGSAGPVPCYVSCPEHCGGHRLQPALHNCLGDPQQAPTDLVRTWQVCLTSYTGQCCMWNIVAPLLASVLMLRKKHDW